VSSLLWIAVVAGAVVAVWAAGVAALMLAGRRADARAWGGFVPDCVVLVRRLLADPSVPRSRKALLAGLAVYLALPFDLVPDVIPVAGQLDDAILAAFVLRVVLRSGGPELLARHWPGPDRSLRVVRRLAFGPAVSGTARAR
jgi:uncharacterized membrane protein YkvA (DUF1232 family)